MGMFLKQSLNWLEDSLHDKGGKGGGEWASLIHAFLHGNGFPFICFPFNVDVCWCVINKCGEGDEFWKVSAYDVEEFIMRYLVEHIVEINTKRAHVGNLFCCCGRMMMYHSMDSCIALMMKSIPPSMPTA